MPIVLTCVPVAASSQAGRAERSGRARSGHLFGLSSRKRHAGRTVRHRNRIKGKRIKKKKRTREEERWNRWKKRTERRKSWGERGGGRGETTRRRFNFLIRRDVTVRLPEILASPRSSSKLRMSGVFSFLFVSFIDFSPFFFSFFNFRNLFILLEIFAIKFPETNRFFSNSKFVESYHSRYKKIENYWIVARN